MSSVLSRFLPVLGVVAAVGLFAAFLPGQAGATTATASMTSGSIGAISAAGAFNVTFTVDIPAGLHISLDDTSVLVADSGALTGSLLSNPTCLASTAPGGNATVLGAGPLSTDAGYSAGYGSSTQQSLVTLHVHVAGCAFAFTSSSDAGRVFYFQGITGSAAAPLTTSVVSKYVANPGYVVPPTPAGTTFDLQPATPVVTPTGITTNVILQSDGAPSIYDLQAPTAGFTFPTMVDPLGPGTGNVTLHLQGGQVLPYGTQFEIGMASTGNLTDPAFGIAPSSLAQVDPSTAPAFFLSVHFTLPNGGDASPLVDLDLTHNVPFSYFVTTHTPYTNLRLKSFDDAGVLKASTKQPTVSSLTLLPLGSTAAYCNAHPANCSVEYTFHITHFSSYAAFGAAFVGGGGGGGGLVVPSVPETPAATTPATPPATNPSGAASAPTAGSSGSAAPLGAQAGAATPTKQSPVLFWVLGGVAVLVVVGAIILRRRAA